MVKLRTGAGDIGKSEAVARNGERMVRLLANARAGQWSIGDEIDWDLGPRLPFWWPRRALAETVSQLYHGELATADFCRHLAAQLQDPVAIECLRFQITDETRHAALYDGYLARMGGRPTMQPALVLAIRGVETWQGPLEGRVLAYHLVLEGEALLIQDAFARIVPCPLFRQINRRILRDEARHVAFGRIFLGRRLPRLDRALRLEIYRWLRDLWWSVARASVAEAEDTLFWARHGLRAGIGDRWKRQQAGLLAVGLIDRDDLAVLERPYQDRIAS